MTESQMLETAPRARGLGAIGCLGQIDIKQPELQAMHGEPKIGRAYVVGFALGFRFGEWEWYWSVCWLAPWLIWGYSI